MRWFWQELTRPPHTFLHGDLRLDQLFFAVEADDPPVTALDWQITSKGRGAYDVAYFLTQSLATETRRTCESQLIERYAEGLAEHGIDYPPRRTMARLPAHHGVVLRLPGNWRRSDRTRPTIAT